MEYFAILTLELPGRELATAACTVIVDDGTSRDGILTELRSCIAEQRGYQFETACVAFFSVEPNRFAS